MTRFLFYTALIAIAASSAAWAITTSKDITITITGGGGQTVGGVTLTNGPPNIPYAGAGACGVTTCTWIPGGMPSGSPVSDVYADLTPISSNFSGSFSLSGPQSGSFSISTSSDGTRNVGHITTVGTVAAGDYDITVTAGTATRRTTVHAVSGTAVACGNTSSQIQSIANSAGNGATLTFTNCNYNWNASVAVPSNHIWVGIPGQTIFDANGGELSGSCSNIMLCGYNAGTSGATIANITLQNHGTNFANANGCTTGVVAGFPQCAHQGVMIVTDDGWNIRNSSFLNGVFMAVNDVNHGSGTQHFTNHTVRHFGAFGLFNSCGPNCGAFPTFNVIGNTIQEHMDSAATRLRNNVAAQIRMGANAGQADSVIAGNVVGLGRDGRGGVLEPARRDVRGIVSDSANAAADVDPIDCHATNRPVNPGIMLPFVTGTLGSDGKLVNPPF